MRFKALFFLILGLTARYAVHAQHDTLYLTNGDFMVGEVKSMKNGVLKIETDYSDTDFLVEWEKVAEMHSDQPFLIRYIGSDYVNGTFVMDPGDSTMIIISLEYGSSLNVPIQSIVYLSELGGSWKDRLKADVAAGLNFTKANNLRQFNVTGNLGYYTADWSLSASGNSLLSSQDDVDDTRRTDATLGYTLYLRNAWQGALGVSFLSNDEINLRYRVVNGATFGKNWFQTNTWYFNTSLGVANTEEVFSDPEGTARNSWEGVVSVELNLFDLSDLDLLFSFVGYPGLTERGRFRYDTKISLKYDLPLDFFIKLSTTVNFDNQPTGDAERLDYVIQTTFGWEL